MHKIMYRFVILFGMSIIFIGCSKPCKTHCVMLGKVKDSFNTEYDERNYYVDEKAKVQTGIASYYASCMNGKYTASGETCNIDAYTAAHRSLPFGTIIRVTMLQNGKSVLVKVNDRGPHVRGRVVDVSPAAARKIGLDRAGVAKVTIEKLKKLL